MNWNVECESLLLLLSLFFFFVCCDGTIAPKCNAKCWIKWINFDIYICESNEFLSNRSLSMPVPFHFICSGIRFCVFTKKETMFFMIKITVFNIQCSQEQKLLYMSLYIAYRMYNIPSIWMVNNRNVTSNGLHGLLCDTGYWRHIYCF